MKNNIIKIFEFTSYKAFFHARLKNLPGRGRGELTRVAQALNIHTTMVTRIFRGEAHLTIEQALDLASHLGFNQIESDYLIALVQHERAGTNRAKEFFKSRITELSTKALNLNRRLEARNELSESDRAFYYSTWAYSYLRLLTAIDRFQTVEALATQSRLPIGRVREAIDFLVSRGLCKEEDGRIKFGAISTYVESTSPLVVRHHLNWRHKVQENFDRIAPRDLVFTFPTVLSQKDAEKVREKIVQLIEEIKQISEPSPSDELYALNIDWLKVT